MRTGRGFVMGILFLGTLLLVLFLGACAGGEAAPTAIPSPEPTATSGPKPTATSEPTPTVEATRPPTPSPTPATVATPTASPAPTPTVAAPITPTRAPKGTFSTPTPAPTPTLSPTATPAPPPKVWRIGLLADISSTNIWDILGPIPSTWNFYVFGNMYPTLYRLSDVNLSWVPVLAKGRPGDLTQEGELWTMEVELKDGVQWSDGVDVTARDVAFTVNTALELELPGNWAAFVDPNLVDRAEVMDDRTVKFYFKGKPGLARWEFGLSQALIVAKHYWEPVVDAARKSGTLEEQQNALFGHVPENEPTAGGMLFSKWEPGEFVELKKNPNYYWAGSTVKEYPNGAYVEEKPDVFQFQDYGDPEGDPSVTLTRGPHVDSVIFRVYERVP